MQKEGKGGKQWVSLHNKNPLPSTTDRATAVADFCMITGHGYQYLGTPE